MRYTVRAKDRSRFVSKGLVDWPRYATRAKDWWTARDTRLGQRIGVLAETHDSGKGLVDWPRHATRAKDWWTGRGTQLGQRTGVLASRRNSIMAGIARAARIFPRRFRRLLGKSKRRCLYKSRIDGGEGSLLILLLPEPSNLTPLGRSVPFCLLTDQVGMASTPPFSVSSFSSSLFSPVPPPREERRRSSDSSGNQSIPESSSSGVMTGAEAKVLQALEVMKSLYDFNSTICLESLGSVRKRFSIPNEYVLHAPRSGQRSYHPYPGGFGISIDALEAGLRFSLHPVIGECLSWWRVSPGQIAPNSWHYIITFLGECMGSEIVPRRNLFLSCFRLCRGQGGYYLTARSGFRVGGAPSNNKGWKSRFLFVSRCQGYDFGIEWSAHPISNVLPNLSDEEANVVERLKGILSASRAVRNLIEEWLVEAGLSPASRDGEHEPDAWKSPGRGGDVLGLRPRFWLQHRHFHQSHPASPVQLPTCRRFLSRRPGGARSLSEASGGGDSVGQKKKDRRRSPHKADRASKGKGPVDTSVEPPAPRQRPKSVRELCSAQAGVDGRDYHAIRMCNIPEQASDAPLDPDLRPLTHGTSVWQSGGASATYI
ncbi:hypothetical protein BHM03_00062580 [Ensete ventricosum]|nr:hypothetical protein BHM03_00062580 [Ensete ventricosum]